MSIPEFMNCRTNGKAVGVVVHSLVFVAPFGRWIEFSWTVGQFASFNQFGSSRAMLASPSELAAFAIASDSDSASGANNRIRPGDIGHMLPSHLKAIEIASNRVGISFLAVDDGNSHQLATIRERVPVINVQAVDFGGFHLVSPSVRPASVRAS